MFCSLFVSENTVEGIEPPLFLTEFVLKIPQILLSPSVEELQQCFSNFITNIVGVSKEIVMWGQRNFQNEQFFYEDESIEIIFPCFFKHFSNF